MISLQTLHKLGYRVCHAKNIGKASSVLKRIATGRAVLTADIDAAARALDYAPLSQHDVIVIQKDQHHD